MRRNARLYLNTRSAVPPVRRLENVRNRLKAVDDEFEAARQKSLEADKKFRDIQKKRCVCVMCACVCVCVCVCVRACVCLESERHRQRSASALAVALKLCF